MSKTVKPIPDGFRTITPYLTLRDAAPAIDFYKKAFGAQEVMRMPGPEGKGVMHAELRIGDSRRSVRNRAITWSAGVGAWGGGTATYVLSAALVRGPMMPSIGPGS